MNYITEAFKALEDVNEGIILEKVEKQPVKKVAKKPIKESKQMHYTPRPNRRSLKEGVFDSEDYCNDMIHSIMAYSRDFKDGEDLVAEQEKKSRNYLDDFISGLLRAEPKGPLIYPLSSNTSPNERVV